MGKGPNRIELKSHRWNRGACPHVYYLKVVNIHYISENTASTLQAELLKYFIP